MPTILIVEDEPSNARLAAMICRCAGYSVELASNGQEALERLSQAVFDVLLLDMAMPIMGGLELVRVLRGDPLYRRLPVVGVTARAMGPELASIEAAGLAQLVIKPYPTERLRQAIRCALEQAEV
jgi:CheY-like chemotaxis protein